MKKIKKYTVIFLGLVAVFCVVFLATASYKAYKSYKFSKQITNDYYIYKNTHEKTLQEYLRCKQFVTKQEGNFDELKYCQKYIDYFFDSFGDE
jgi:hypothetical protein